MLALLFVSGMAIASTLFIAGFTSSSSYSNATSGYVTTEYEQTANQTMALAGEMNNTVTNMQVTGFLPVDLPLYVVRGGYDALKLTFKSIDIFNSLFTAIISSSHLPLGWFQMLAMAGIAIIVLFGIISVLMRFDILGGRY
jgi:hypothetical protein